MVGLIIIGPNIAFGYDYSNLISTPSPVHMYEFNNDLKDSITNNYVTATGELSYVDGLKGKALNLNGNSGYTMTDPNLDISHSFSFSVWTKIPPNSNSFDNGIPIIYNNNFFFRTDPFTEAPNRVAFFINIKGAVEPRVWADYEPNVWQYWTVTWDGSILKLYRGAELVSQQNRAGILLNDDKITVGEDGFTGQLEDLRIYDKALSDDQVFILNYGLSSPVLELIVISVSIVFIEIMLKIRHVKKLSH